MHVVQVTDEVQLSGFIGTPALVSRCTSWCSLPFETYTLKFVRRTTRTRLVSRCISSCSLPLNLTP